MKYVNDFLKYLQYEKHFSNYTVSNYQIDLEEFKHSSILKIQTI